MIYIANKTYHNDRRWGCLCKEFGWLALGLVGAYGASRFLESVVFGVRPIDAVAAYGCCG